MTITTDTYWEAQGTALNTYAYNISTLGSDRDNVPPLRGDDIVIPFRPGQLFIPKQVDSRTITLAMWVQGCNTDGTIPRTGSAQRALYEKNLRKLRRLLWTPYRQFKLTKRFHDDYGTVVAGDAMVQFTGGLAPEMLGNAHGTFTVDLKLCDPYFYGRLPVTIRLNASTAVKAAIGGDAPTNKVTVKFTTGANPQLTNVTDGVMVKYGATVPSAADIVIDSDAALAYRSDTLVSVRDKMTHTGARLWFQLQPGPITLRAAVTSGSINTQLIYYPAYH